MATRKILTDTGIRAARERAKKAGRALWIADGAIPRTHGGLQLFVHPNGTPRWYWRYSTPAGTKTRIALGAFTAQKTAGALTLTEAREEVARKAALYLQAESRDVRAHLERVAHAVTEAKAEAERERKAAEQTAADAGQFTLAKLLGVYVAHLQKQGKQSAYDAENLFANHVTRAHATVAAMPAKDVTPRDVVTILRTLTEADKGRTAAKLRSYLRAAYAIAARAELDSTAPAAFLPFKVEVNPAQPTAALSEYNRALERTLSEPELREFWTALKASPDSAARDALMLGLLLGGQRPAQLLRATVADVDNDAGLIRLHDPKGKRTQPRVHTLPLSDSAAPIVARCIARAEKQESQWLFSTHGGAPLRPETVTAAAAEIAAALLAKPKARRIVRETFQLRDLRRTCETSLARVGISKDIRAQLQSHGLGGIQGRHYDKHDYATEKAAALTAWAAHLEAEPADNVRQLRGGRPLK